MEDKKELSIDLDGVSMSIPSEMFKSFLLSQRCFKNKLKDGINQYEKGPWLEEEDERLISAVTENGDRNWALISSIVGTRGPKQCRERYRAHLSPTINTSPFTQEEDEIIVREFNLTPNKWARISKFLDNRTPASIKSRYTSVLSKRCVNSSHPSIHRETHQERASSSV